MKSRGGQLEVLVCFVIGVVIVESLLEGRGLLLKFLGAQVGVDVVRWMRHGMVLVLDSCWFLYRIRPGLVDELADDVSAGGPAEAFPGRV